MKIFLLTTTFFFGLVLLSNGQVNKDEPKKAPAWTEADRKYLLDNLIRGREEIVAETKNLNQWNYK